LNTKEPKEETTKYHRKIAQYSYRAYPPAKAINSKLKKVNLNTAPTHHFNRTDPPDKAENIGKIVLPRHHPPPAQSHKHAPKQSQENKKSVPAHHPDQQSDQIYSYRPGTPHSGDAHTPI
jgi:hypothetical protein